MKPPQSLPAFDSHAAFYREAYGHAVVKSHRVGTLGTSLVLANQGAGDWSDAPTPDLVIGILARRSPSTTARVDLGAGRFEGVHRPGDFILIAPHIGCSLKVHGPHSVWCIGIPYARLRAMAGEETGLPHDGDFGTLHTRVIREPEVEQIVTRMVQRADANEPGAGIWADGAALQLASALLRLKGAPLSKAAKGMLAPWQLRRITDYIEARLDQELSLAELAGLLGITPHHACRAFQRSTGVPPLRWQMHRRIEAARDLLEHTAMPVTEIAARVGYNDPSGFAAAFKGLVGVTPSQFRRQRLS